MLSWLISSMRCRALMNGGDSIPDLYLLLKPAIHHVKDLVNNRIPVGMYSYKVRNLQRLVHGLRNDKVPAIQLERAKMETVHPMWAGVLDYFVSFSTLMERKLGRALSQHVAHSDQCGGC